MMRAISLHQPWASLMANGSKLNETRNSRTKYRGEVAICAARKWTRQLQELACSDPFLGALTGRAEFNGHSEELLLMTHVIMNTPLGCVVAVGELFDDLSSDEWMRMHAGALKEDVQAVIRERTFGNYAPGRGVWRFRNMRKLAKPVPVIGRQFWFSLTPEQEAAVRAQI